MLNIGYIQIYTYIFIYNMLDKGYIYIYIYLDEGEDRLMYGKMGKVLELLGQAKNLKYLEICN